MARTSTCSLRRCAAALAVLALTLLTGSPARAEDIDIFAGIAANNDLPNVLIVWDNSANWGANISVPNCFYTENGVTTTLGPKASNPDQEQGKKMAIEKCAIYNVIDALATAADGSALFNVGLMLFNESPAQNSGGYPRQQFLPLTAANKTLLKNTVSAIAINADKGNNAAFAKTLYEAYLMFKKDVPYRGTLGTKWDHNAVIGNHYVGPPGSGCGRNHIIFVANGGPGEVTNAEAMALLQAQGANVTPLIYPTSYIANSDQANWADEGARFFRQVDVVPNRDGVQSITTHAIAVTGASSDGLYPNFIKAIAIQGGGQYYAASNIAALVKALTDIFNSIQAVNSAFASASLPVSVNTQGTYKNQVFVGMFRPDQNARPRWYGNLKEYQMVYDAATDTLRLGDRDGNEALNSSTGFVSPSAVSYWTTHSAFWVNDPKGTPPSANDEPDGEIVEKGAVAEGLRVKYATDQSLRNVYTCLTCAANTALAGTPSLKFVSTNAAITAAMLGASGDSERGAIIDWVRGTDNNNDELGPGAPTTVRPSVHGDVLHSRPAVIDYGGSTGTIVFYGGNDGMLHAVDGNQSGATAGQELWSFVPQEFLSRFKRIRDNSPEVRFPNTPSGSSAIPRDYFVDGPITVYQNINAAGAVTQVVIFVSMRRGGRLLYAFDVTTPSNPVFLWRKSSADFAVLGQTWSEPRVALVKGRTNPVLVMGAGYDPTAEDANPAGAPTMGNAVLVLDAFQGYLVKSLATDRPVPAAVALLDSDFDGYTDRAYAVDMGANVYRIDFELADGSSAQSGWTISKFASLSDAAKSRKFFYAPDLVQTNKFVAVILGSGDREKPLGQVSNDRFYTLLDYKLTKGPPYSPTAITDADLTSVASFSATGNPAGCYLELDHHGEKAVTSAVSTGGYTYFSTNEPTPPSASSCSSNLGIAKVYKIPLFCGTPESEELAGGGLPPSPVIGVVEIQVPARPQTPGDTSTKPKLVPFIIGGLNSELSGLAATKVPVSVDPTRRRTYWLTHPSR